MGLPVQVRPSPRPCRAVPYHNPNPVPLLYQVHHMKQPNQDIAARRLQIQSLCYHVKHEHVFPQLSWGGVVVTLS